LAAPLQPSLKKSLKDEREYDLFPIDLPVSRNERWRVSISVSPASDWLQNSHGSNLPTALP
ncbi:MAG: hypothetical protein QM488_11645, partial [Rhizobiaceae bacterium]